jgi:hypothetical protein
MISPGERTAITSSPDLTSRLPRMTAYRFLAGLPFLMSLSPFWQSIRTLFSRQASISPALDVGHWRIATVIDRRLLRHITSASESRRIPYLSTCCFRKERAQELKGYVRRPRHPTERKDPTVVGDSPTRRKAVTSACRRRVRRLHTHRLAHVDPTEALWIAASQSIAVVPVLTGPCARTEAPPSL